MKQASNTQAAPQSIATLPLGWRQIRIVLIASLGQFVGQGLATLVGIVIPLMQLALHPELSALMQGLLGCVSLIGIMIGTLVFGRLSDRYGYLLFFRLCPALLTVAAVAAALLPHPAATASALFVMGFAIGGEYSLDPDYISELMPESWRTRMVGLAKALASAGSAAAAAICLMVLGKWHSPEHWSLLFLVIAGIGAAMVLLRLRWAESPAWLAERGLDAQAQAAARKLLDADVTLPVQTAPKTKASGMGLGTFIRTNFRKVILTGVPWACEGLGVYGIGIFLPVLIMAFGLDGAAEHAGAMEHIRSSVGLTLILCVVMMAGFALGLILLRRGHPVRLQIWGFVLSAVGLGVLATATALHWPAWVAIAGFVLFELALNAGPHLVTFVLPSSVYAVEDRGTGSGIAASVGKAGAVIGAFVIPVLLRDGGVMAVLGVSIAVMAAGAIITIACRGAAK